MNYVFWPGRGIFEAKLNVLAGLVLWTALTDGKADGIGCIVAKTW